MFKLFYFGWVSSNINSNYFAWSSHKNVGTIEEAEAFYAETFPQYEEKVGMEWFCYPVA